MSPQPDRRQPHPLPEPPAEQRPPVDAVAEALDGCALVIEHLRAVRYAQESLSPAELDRETRLAAHVLGDVARALGWLDWFGLCNYPMTVYYPPDTVLDWAVALE